LLQILASAAFLTLSLANFTSILLEAFAQISLKTRTENASREKMHQTHWCKKAIHKSGKIDTGKGSIIAILSSHRHLK